MTEHIPRVSRYVWRRLGIPKEARDAMHLEELIARALEKGYDVVVAIRPTNRKIGIVSVHDAMGTLLTEPEIDDDE